MHLSGHFDPRGSEGAHEKARRPRRGRYGPPGPTVFYYPVQGGRSPPPPKNFRELRTSEVHGAVKVCSGPPRGWNETAGRVVSFHTAVPATKDVAAPHSLGCWERTRP